MDEDIFCEDCGEMLKEHFVSKYDRKTGARETRKHCPNINCVSGCSYAGHIWKWYQRKCRRCGYTICDYY